MYAVAVEVSSAGHNMAVVNYTHADIPKRRQRYGNKSSNSQRLQIIGRGEGFSAAGHTQRCQSTNRKDSICGTYVFGLPPYEPIFQRLQRPGPDHAADKRTSEKQRSRKVNKDIIAQRFVVNTMG